MNERFGHEGSRIMYETAIDELERDLNEIINNLHEGSDVDEGFMSKAQNLKEQIVSIESKLSECDQ